MDVCLCVCESASLSGSVKLCLCGCLPRYLSTCFCSLRLSVWRCVWRLSPSLSLSLSLSGSPSLCLGVWGSISTVRSVWVSLSPVRLFVSGDCMCASMCVCVCLCVGVCLRLSLCQSLCLSLSLSVHKCECLFCQLSVGACWRVGYGVPMFVGLGSYVVVSLCSHVCIFHIVMLYASIYTKYHMYDFLYMYVCTYVYN